LITPTDLGEPPPGVCGGDDGVGAGLGWATAAGLSLACGNDACMGWPRGMRSAGLIGLDDADATDRFGATRYPQTPQNRALGSSGESQDGHVIPANFRRTIQTWHATFQRKSA
jgi:hypothetical protein